MQHLGLCGNNWVRELLSANRPPLLLSSALADWRFMWHWTAWASRGGLGAIVHAWVKRFPASCAIVTIFIIQSTQHKPHPCNYLKINIVGQKQSVNLNVKHTKRRRRRIQSGWKLPQRLCGVERTTPSAFYVPKRNTQISLNLVLFLPPQWHFPKLLCR